MAEIKTDIEINSSAEKVWKELMDFEKFPEWNPFLKEVKILSERLEVGSKLKTNIDGTTFKPKVTKLNPNKEFHWLGRLIFPRIFDGRHMFEIEKINEDQIRFVHKEQFRGILVWPILKIIGKKTQKGFENMNKALKERVEAS